MSGYFLFSQVMVGFIYPVVRAGMRDRVTERERQRQETWKAEKNSDTVLNVGVSLTSTGIASRSDGCLWT